MSREENKDQREGESAPSSSGCSTAVELNLDVSGDHARALHRVVRAMHDGHCPKCGYLGPAENFWADEKPNPTCEADEGHHECPVCHFSVSETEARAALTAFQPYLDKSVALFEQWRRGESSPLPEKQQPKQDAESDRHGLPVTAYPAVKACPFCNATGDVANDAWWDFDHDDECLFSDSHLNYPCVAPAALSVWNRRDAEDGNLKEAKRLDGRIRELFQAFAGTDSTGDKVHPLHDIDDVLHELFVIAAVESR